MTNILITNGKLGRQGKTTLSYTIYKHAKKPFQYITNDMDNASVSLAELIPADDLHFFSPDTDMNIDGTKNSIFDFGGEPDGRLLQVAEHADVVIIPISFISDSELEITIQNVNAISEVNENIVIVINKTDTEDVPLIQKVFKVTYPKIPIFIINNSRYIRRLSNDNQTVFEVAESNKRDAGQLNKTVIPQFEKLLNYLNTNY